MGWRATKAAFTASTGCPLVLACASIRSVSEGDSTVPGQIALQRMPRVTKSAAIDLVSPITAAFEVAYTKRLGAAFTLLAMDAMLTMEPPP